MQAIKRAVQARIREGADTDYELYRVINQQPANSIYELAKITGWSTGKVRGSVMRLERDGYVCTERSIRNGKAVLRVSPVGWTEFFTEAELEAFREMEF